MTDAPVSRDPSERSASGRSVPRTPTLSAVLAIALLAIAAVAPTPVFADNGASLTDLWATFDAAVFAGFATPVLIWALTRARLPPEAPSPIERLASEFIDADIAGANVAAPAPDPGRASKAAS